MDEQPELFPDVIWLWNAFQLLSETRDYGFGGPLRIKPSDMQAYFQMKGIRHEDDLDLALRVIPALDSIWLDDHYKEAEKRTEKTKKRR